MFAFQAKDPHFASLAPFGQLRRRTPNCSRPTPDARFGFPRIGTVGTRVPMESVALEQVATDRIAWCSDTPELVEWGAGDIGPVIADPAVAAGEAKSVFRHTPETGSEIGNPAAQADTLPIAGTANKANNRRCPGQPWNMRTENSVPRPLRKESQVQKSP